MLKNLIFVIAALCLCLFISAAAVRAQQWDSKAIVPVTQTAELPPKPSILPFVAVGVVSIAAAVGLLVISQRRKAASVRIG